jgi:hypothetical protein
MDRVTKEFFEGTPLTWNWRLEGARVVEGALTFGCRAGPESSVVNLAHEMGHFVEIEDERMLHFGWGLRVPEVEVLGQICVEPRTHQMTDREIRVIAFQKNLLDYLGVEETVEELVSSMTFMPDFMLIPLENGRPAYTRKGPATDLDYNEVTKSRLRWIAKQVEKKRRTRAFSAQRFISEWFRKAEVIRANPSIGLE